MLRTNMLRILLIVSILLMVCVIPANPVSAGINVWSSIGPEGGVIYTLAIDPITPTTLYAGTVGGVFKSTNGGGNWRVVNTGLTNTAIHALAIDPATPTTLYAGTDNGVFKSTNGGGNWSVINTGLSTWVYALAIDPATPTTLYAGTPGAGVFKSTNGGGNWSVINTGLSSTYPYVCALAIDPATPTTLYAGTSSDGVFKSTNGGENWSVINTGLITNTTICDLAIDPATPTTLYTGTRGGGVFKSINGGGNWSVINTGLSNTYVNALAIDPATPNTLYAGISGDGVFKSTNGGGNWSVINTGLTNTTVHALAIDPATPTTLYAGTDRGGMFKSTNGGGNWSVINTGLSSFYTYALAIDPVMPTTLYTGTNNGVFKSTNGGGNWSAVNTGLTNIYLTDIYTLAIDPATPTTLYAGEINRGVFKSMDGGGNWSASNTGLTNINVNALAIAPATPNTLYAGTWGGIFKSTNGGGNWSALNTGLTNTTIHALTIDPATPTTLYAGTDNGVFKSTNGGGNWSEFNTGLSTRVYALAIDPATPTTLYAGTDNGVFKSTNGGGNWSEFNTGLSDTRVYALAIDPATPTTLYAGTQYCGVFKSTNGGGNWSEFNTGLSDTRVYALAIDPATPTTLYAGTAFHGVFVIQQNLSTYSLSGKVTTSGGMAMSGVTISAGSGNTTITDANGSYLLSGLTPGNYTITPSKTGYSFSPPTRQVTITNANLIAQNFEGQNLKTIPIILLPGIMGSRLHNNPKTDFACLLHYKGEVWLNDIFTLLIHGGELTLKPDSPASADSCDQIYPEGIFDSGDNDVYSDFISSMKKDGYTVHSFSYDWRLSLEDSANQLDTFINGLNVPKVVLVGHSMGGLLAHTYIANSTHAAKVDKVISVGSPYWGSPKLALSMRSGLPPKEIRIPQTDYYLALPVVADIIRNSPGAMVLLPSESYLASADGNYYYKNDDQALNTFDAIKDFFVSNSGKRGKQNAGLIDQSRAYHTAMDDFASSLNSVDYYILATNHLQTRNVIREYPCTFLLLPDTCYEIVSYAMGDETVPYISASLPGKAGNAEVITLSPGMVTNDHGGLMKDQKVINNIKAILSGNPYPVAMLSALAATPAPLIQVSVWGDAKVSVKNNANQFLGLDAAGYRINEIPGATADFNENWTEIVLPSGQTYTVKFEQKSTIPLKLKITDLRTPSADVDFTPNQRAVFVDIPSQPGGVATLPLDLSAGLDSLRLSNDTNNDGTPEQTQPPTSVLNAQQTQDTTMPVTAIDIQGVHNSVGIYRGPVTITLSAADTGLGVHETKYSLDGGKTWQVYSTPLTFDASTTSMFYAYSVDRAGNSEYPFKTQLLGYRTFLPATIR